MDRQSAPVAAAARGAGDWLASIQQANGSLGVSESLPEPGWATPYALLAWKAIGGYEQSASSPSHGCFTRAGAIVPKQETLRPAYGHDASIIGWSWVNGTHSWVEPTALAILALRRKGLSDHTRVQDGLRLLRDRTIISGGWNYGNTSIYGRVLRPNPQSTGLALLSLADTRSCGDLPAKATRYLLETLPGVTAAASLGWGILGLLRWGRSPDEADRWLAASFDELHGRPTRRQGWRFYCWPRGKRQWRFSMRNL